LISEKPNWLEAFVPSLPSPFADTPTPLEQTPHQEYSADSTEPVSHPPRVAAILLIVPVVKETAPKSRLGTRQVE